MPYTIPENKLQMDKRCSVKRDTIYILEVNLEKCLYNLDVAICF